MKLSRIILASAIAGVLVVASEIAIYGYKGVFSYSAFKLTDWIFFYSMGFFPTLCSILIIDRIIPKEKDD